VFPVDSLKQAVGFFRRGSSAGAYTMDARQVFRNQTSPKTMVGGLHTWGVSLVNTSIGSRNFCEKVRRGKVLLLQQRPYRTILISWPLCGTQGPFVVGCSAAHSLPLPLKMGRYQVYIDAATPNIAAITKAIPIVTRAPITIVPSARMGLYHHGHFIHAWTV
jgi:hypothetical protein